MCIYIYIYIYIYIHIYIYIYIYTHTCSVHTLLKLVCYSSYEFHSCCTIFAAI